MAKKDALELVHTIETGGGKALAVAFHPSEATVAAGLRDGTVLLIDAESGQVAHRLTGHREFVFCLAWDPDGGSLLSSGKDTTMRVWSADGKFQTDWAGIVRGAGARTMYNSMQVAGEGHTRTPLSLAFSEDGRFVGSGGQDHLVKLWQDGRVKRTFNWHGGPVTAVAFRPNTDVLLSASRDGTVRTWNPETGSMIHKYTGHEDEIEAVVWLDTDRFVTGDVSGRALFWSEANEKPEGEGREDSAVRCLAASPDGERVYLGLESGDVIVRNTATGRRSGNKRLFELEAHDMAVRSLSASSNGKLVASGGNDGLVKIWRVH